MAAQPAPRIKYGCECEEQTCWCNIAANPSHRQEYHCFPAVIDCVSGIEREHWLYGLKNSMVCLSEGTTLTYFKMIRAHSKHHVTHNHMCFNEIV